MPKSRTKRLPKVNESVPDPLDLLIIEKMLEDSTVTFKRLATLTKSDQRTIAKRYNRLKKAGIIRPTIEVDWSRMGLGAFAYVGTATQHGEDSRRDLFEFIQEEPRILEAYKSLGSHEYFMKVLDTGMEKLRSEIFDKLEPLTVGLSSSIIVERIKTPDQIGLLHYLKRPSREPLPNRQQ